MVSPAGVTSMALVIAEEALVVSDSVIPGDGASDGTGDGFAAFWRKAGPS
ncbi:hypothetical protein ACWGIN_31440 [Streptomyces sp. NPDC054861]